MKTLIPILFFIVSSSFTIGQAPAIQWKKSLGGVGNDLPYSIKPTADGGYIMAATSDANSGDVTGNHGSFDFWIVKLDDKGSIQWQKSFGGIDDDEATSIQQTTDGGYIATGWSFSTDGDVTGNHGNNDFWVVKLDANGNLEWQKTLGGSYDDEAYSIQQTNDGGYIVAGLSASNDGNVTGHHADEGLYDYWVVKLEPDGDLEWQKSLGGSLDDVARSIQQTNDGNFIVAGYSFSSDNDVTDHRGGTDYPDYWVVKLNTAGSILWEKSLGGTSLDLAYSIQQTTDNGYIVNGFTYSTDGDVTGNNGDHDFWVVKLNGEGNLQWQKSLGGTLREEGRSIYQTLDGGYIAAGLSYSNDKDVTGHHGADGFSDYWIVKLDVAGNKEWQKSLGGSSTDVAVSIQQTGNGAYILAGSSSSNDGDVSGQHGGNDCWIIKLGVDTTTCPGADVISIEAGTFPGGTNFQWQVDNGGGFQNISNNAQYSGANNNVLVITNAPSAWYGYQYRCQLTGTITATTDITTIKFTTTWTGAQDNIWSNPANWSCGILPDGNTDVVIPNGNVLLNANGICRSLKVRPGATFTVGPGNTLTITH